MNKKIIKNIIILLIFFIIQYFFSSFPLFFSDEHENLLQGLYFEKIYSTVFINHMPLSPLIVKISSTLIGGDFNLSNLRFLNTIINTFILFLIYKISFLITNKKMISIIGPIMYLVWENTFWAKLYLTENPSSLFGLIALYILLNGIKNRSFYKEKIEIKVWVLIGFFIGLGTTARFNLSYIAPFLFIAYILLKIKNTNKKIDLLKTIKLLSIYIFSYLIPIAAFFIFFKLNGNLNDFIKYAFLFNLEQNKSGIVLQKFIPPIGSSTFYYLIGSITLFLISLTLSKEHRKNYILIFIYTIFAWLGCNPTGLGDVPFHAIPGLAGLCILNATTAPLFFKIKNKFYKKTIFIIFIIFISLSIYKNKKEFINFQKMSLKDDQNSALFIENNRISEIISQNSNKTDKIYIIGHNPYIYWKSGRVPAINNDMIFNNNSDEIVNKLKKENPRFIYFPNANNEFHYWNIINNKNYKEFFQYLTSNYRFSKYDPQLLEKINQTNKDNYILLPQEETPNLIIEKEISVNNNWESYKNIKNNSILIENNNWDEIHQEINLKIDKPNLSKIKIIFNCPKIQKNGNVRILFDGEESLKHINFWYTYVNINKKNTSFEIPLNNFSKGNGDIQWNKITNIAIGGNDGELNCQLQNFKIISYKPI